MSSSIRPLHLLCAVQSCVFVACSLESPIEDEFAGLDELTSPVSNTIEAPSSSPATTPPPEPGVPSCDEYLQLPAGLSYHLLQGECIGQVCSFDYDPPEQLITQVTGSYSQATGDFAWTLVYQPDHWRVSTSVSGNGTISEAGDETSSFTRTTLDVAGVATQESVTLERVGCAMSTQTTRDGVTLGLDGVFYTEFDYTQEQLPALSGRSTPVDAWGTYAVGLRDESVSVEPSLDSDPFWWGLNQSYYLTHAGNDYLEFYQWSPLLGRSRSGYCQTDIDGRVVCEADIDDNGVYHFGAWWYDYAGYGAGVHEYDYFDPMSQTWALDWCEVTFSGGGCSEVCDLNPNGDCSSFLFDE